MSDKNKIEYVDYIRFVENRISWYGKKSKEYMIIYNSLRISMILLGAILPFVVAQENKVIASAIGVFVAAATGIEGFFRPGEKWQIFRTTQIALQGELHRYQIEIYDIPMEERIVSNEKYKGAYTGFMTSTEKIMADEAAKFWNLANSDSAKNTG